MEEMNKTEMLVMGTYIHTTIILLVKRCTFAVRYRKVLFSFTAFSTFYSNVETPPRCHNIISDGT